MEGVEEAGILEGTWVSEGKSSWEVSGVLEVGSAWPWQAGSFWSIVASPRGMECHFGGRKSLGGRYCLGGRGGQNLGQLDILLNTSCLICK